MKAVTPPPHTPLSFLRVSLLGVLFLIFILFGFTACDDDYDPGNVNVTVTNMGEWYDAIERINSTRGIGLSHTITVDGSFHIFEGKDFTSDSSFTLTLKGSGTLHLGNSGFQLNRSFNQHLILDGDITLIGDTSGGPLVAVTGHGGSFTMNAGTISSNSGSGVNIGNYSSFTMNGGAITGNAGGGVRMADFSRFIMNGGDISGNSGSGVVITDSAEFIMNGGTIRGNMSLESGGGVLVQDYSASFIKTGGVIYGNNAPAADKNTAARGNTYGHAVYNEYYPGSGNRVYYRDTTLGENDNISTAALPSTGTGLNWTRKD